MDIKSMTNEALAAALTEKRNEAAAIFALDESEVTIEQVETVAGLTASIGEIEAEQAERVSAANEAAEKFAALRTSFSNGGDAEGDEADDADDAEGDEGDEADDAEGDEGDEADDADDAEGDEGDEGDEGEPAAVTAGADPVRSQKIGSVAKKVGRKTKRPAVKASPAVKITAANDVPGFSTGQMLDDMEQVTKALLARGKGFAPFNLSAAKAINSQTKGAPQLNKVGVASFSSGMPDSLTASSSAKNKDKDYSAMKAALDAHNEALSLSMDRGQTLTAAGWCAPSETIYSYVADYVVDGLLTLPEVSAPRGGINITTGPARSSQGTDRDGFGFDQTEAQAIAGQVKECETIVCPDFEDHRLDAIGYCFKIPFLTQHAYPELVTDALRFANVLYAHKVNARLINEIVALSDTVDARALGASFTDTLEALSVIATRRRRKWNLGRNAIMEVKLPEIALEVFRADMSRRAGLALSDTATDQRIAAEFAARRLSVEYVADWQEQEDDDLAAVIPDSFDALIYPAGTFVKAIEDVVNLSAVYDAASLSVNEYTGVFFEQGILVAKVAYGADKVTIPVCSAGLTGATILSCDGGSF